MNGPELDLLEGGRSPGVLSTGERIQHALLWENTLDRGGRPMRWAGFSVTGNADYVSLLALRAHFLARGITPSPRYGLPALLPAPQPATPHDRVAVNPMTGPRYRDMPLDGPIEEFHQAVDRLRWDTVPAPLTHQSPSPPTPHRRRRDPSDRQATLVEEASCTSTCT